MATIINGKRVNIPSQGISGYELKKKAIGGKSKRRAVISTGRGFKRIKDDQNYTPDLIGKNGKITTIPERTKGDFGGVKSNFTKAVIQEQIVDIAEKLFHNVNCDDENYDWIEIPKYKLPRNWGHIARQVKLRVYFPDDYPLSPPIGFYLDSDIGKSANGHFYGTAYHGAYKQPLTEGWKWYCVYVEPGAWQPAKVRYSGDWKKGDNIYTYFQLIAEVLESGEYDD